MAKSTKPKRRRPAPIENNAVEDTVVRGCRFGYAIMSLLDKFFEAHGITLLQWNVLRILYVQDTEHVGIPTGTFAARMMSFNPDVPRIVDRIVKAELVERISSPTDRRVVLLRLTQKGIDLVEDVTPELLEHNRQLVGTLSTTDLQQLAALLAKANDAVLANRATLED